MLNIFSKFIKKDKTGISQTAEDFFAGLVDIMKNDEYVLGEVCKWLEEKTDFGKQTIDEKDPEMTITACIGYLKIAVISGEIDKKEIKMFVDSLKIKK